MSSQPQPAPQYIRRCVCAKPKAELTLVHTQPALIPGGNTVLRYQTKHGAIFEREESPFGPVHWFRVRLPKPDIARGQVPSGTQYQLPLTEETEE